MPRINLLPWREQQRTDRKKAFAVGVGAALVAALLVTGLGYLMFDQAIAGQRNRNNRLREEIKVLDKQIEEINSLETQKQQFIARMEIIEKLQRSRPEIVHIFDTFVKTVPDGIYLTSISQNDQRFKIQGIAQSPSRVSAFMRSIDASEWLQDAEVEVVETKKGTSAGSEFTLYAKQKVSAAAAAAEAEAEKAKSKAKDKRKKS